MPLRNRVDPYGQLHAVPARGAWRETVAQWRLKRWITPGRYSELFHLDEATAYAAGFDTRSIVRMFAAGLAPQRAR